MSNKSVILLSILFLSPIIIYLLWPSDENRIKKLFREGAEAIEQEKIDEVMAKVSFNYSDERGLTYLYVKEGMLRFFRNMDGIRVEYEIGKIDIRARTATAELDIRITATMGRDTGYIVGDAPRAERMTFSLEKERTTWLVTKVLGMPFRL